MLSYSCQVEGIMYYSQGEFAQRHILNSTRRAPLFLLLFVEVHTVWLMVMAV